MVGEGAVVGAGARVYGSTVLAGAVVEPGAVITDSLIGAGARIGARSVLTGVVVGDGAMVGAGQRTARGRPGVVRARIPAGAVRFSSDQ